MNQTAICQSNYDISIIWFCSIAYHQQLSSFRKLFDASKIKVPIRIAIRQASYALFLYVSQNSKSLEHRGGLLGKLFKQQSLKVAEGPNTICITYEGNLFFFFPMDHQKQVELKTNGHMTQASYGHFLRSLQSLFIISQKIP